MAFKDALQEVGIAESCVIDWRNSKLYQSSGEDTVAFSGYMVLTKDRLLFVSEKGFLKPIKIRYEIDISKIRNISKILLTNRFLIAANTAEEGSGFFKKLAGSKNAQVSVKDGKEFFEKVKQINPEIKL